MTTDGQHTAPSKQLKAGERVEVDLYATATGGRAVGRIDSGQVVFVSGAFEEERCVVELTKSKKRFAEANMVELLAASPKRIAARCEHHKTAVCGGCDWHELDLVAQQEYKAKNVAEQLDRLGGIKGVTPQIIPVQNGYRSTVKLRQAASASASMGLESNSGVQSTSGDWSHAGFYARGTNTGFHLRNCYAIDPNITAILAKLRFRNCELIQIRSSDVHDELHITMFAVSTQAGSLSNRASRQGNKALQHRAHQHRAHKNRTLETGRQNSSRKSDRRVSADFVSPPQIEFEGQELQTPTSLSFGSTRLLIDTNENPVFQSSQQIGSATWLVSGTSFFQTSINGARQMINHIHDLCEDASGALVDLYSGVGVLGASTQLVNSALELVQCVEANPSSCADAVQNLAANLGADGDLVLNQTVEKAAAQSALKHCDVVIADPSRKGLAAQGVEAISQTNAKRLVLVSCDPASLGRDAALLHQVGFRLTDTAVVDMFAHTSRIEAITHWVKE